MAQRRELLTDQNPAASYQGFDSPVSGRPKGSAECSLSHIETPSHPVTPQAGKVEATGSVAASIDFGPPIKPEPLNRYQGRGETHEPWKDRLRSLGRTKNSHRFSACLDGTFWGGSRYIVAPQYCRATGSRLEQVRGAWLHIQELRARGVVDGELEQFAALVKQVLEVAA